MNKKFQIYEENKPFSSICVTITIYIFNELEIVVFCDTINCQIQLYRLA